MVDTIINHTYRISHMPFIIYFECVKKRKEIKFTFLDDKKVRPYTLTH